MSAAAFPVEALAPIEPRTDREHFSISEDEGLISPERRGTARIYSHRDRARLAWILRGKRVGFSLGEIREMIDLYDIGDGRSTQRQVTLERCLERIQTLEHQKHDIDAHIAELQQFVALLKSGDSSH